MCWPAAFRRTTKLPDPVLDPQKRDADNEIFRLFGPGNDTLDERQVFSIHNRKKLK